NTEGLYSRARGVLERGGEKELAIDTRVITRKGCERVIEFAFRLAEKRRNKLTCVDKSNVTQGCKLFRSIFFEISKMHKVDTECMYIDAFALSLMREPETYDVAVTTNMFGDIVTDLAAVLQGGLGMAPSANIGDKYAMFEPVHGSSPDIAGKGIANPIAAILSASMMLDYLSEKHSDAKLKRASKAIEKAVIDTIYEGICTFDIGGTSKTKEVGDSIAKKCERLFEHIEFR
ncbi:MAG: isocitrate/isopropylmalate family dehydrogenase, partial [Thermoplasmata archaeon]